MIAEDVRELGDVGEARQIFQGQRLIGHEGRNHQRQRRVLGARNRDDPVQRAAAANLYAIHPLSSTPNPIDRMNAPPGRPRRQLPGSRDVRASGLSDGAASAARARCCALRRFKFSRSDAARRARRSSSVFARGLSGLMPVLANGEARHEAMKRGRRLDRANEGGGASPIERRNI